MQMRHNESGRSENAVANVVTGVGSKLLTLVLAFSTRTVFIRLLGAEYSGVGSLYTNIFSVLSLSELGLGNVLMFYLYAALRSGDEARIRALVRQFRSIYRAVIAFILTAGLLLIPALRYLVSSALAPREVTLYYVLYLFNTVFSYVAVYRTTVLSADQRIRYSNLVQSGMTALTYVLQIALLLLTHSFLAFLIVQLVCTLAGNLILDQIALRRYPYLRSLHTAQRSPVERGRLFSDVKATFLFRLSDTLLDQTDNILISVLFGTAMVGYYYNYYLIINYLSGVAWLAQNGALASFGNLHTEGDMEKSYRMFRVSLMCFAMFGCVCTSCYACGIQAFIPLWVGEQYLMDGSLVLAILAVFYLRMVTNTVWIYRAAMGLFREVQYINLAAALLNLALSVLMGRWLGVSGVIAATAVSRLLTSFWYEARVLFRHFRKPVRFYYLRQLGDLSLCALAVFVSLRLCRFVTATGFAGFLLRIFIAICVSCTVELAAYFRTEEFRFLCRKLLAVLRRRA